MSTEELSQQFTSAMEEACNRSYQALRYNPIRIRELIGQKGGVGAARDLMARYPDPNQHSDGFGKLWEGKRLDLSVENLMLQPTFQPLFTQQELQLASERLAKYDYQPPLILPSALSPLPNNPIPDALLASDLKELESDTNEITRERVVAAIEQFDREFRESPEWQNWQEDQRHLYAVDYDGKLYPVKKLLSLVTGLPTSEFNGGEPSNRLISSVGFKVVSLRGEVVLFEPEALKTLVESFKNRYVDFESKRYLLEERDYKIAAAEFLRERLGPLDLAQLIATGNFEEAKNRIKNAYTKDNLLGVQDRLRVNNASAEPLTRALYNLLYVEFNEENFRAWVQVLTSETAPYCWPPASYYPALHDPNKQVFVKPTPFRNFLRIVGSSLKWELNTHPSFQFYQQIQELGQKVLEYLKPLKAKDMIDFQSFVWVVPRFWWVNQGNTYEFASKKGIIWAGINNITHHQNLKEVLPGEIILHYSHGALKAVSRVKEKYQEASDPEGQNPEEKVLQVKVEYFPLSSPIPLNDIPASYRKTTYGPFDKNGKVKQIYLEEVKYDLVRELVKEYPTLFPDFVKAEIGLISQTVIETISPPVITPPVVAVSEDYVEPTLEEIIEKLRTSGLRLPERLVKRYHLSLKSRRFVILSGVSGTGKTRLANTYASVVGAKWLTVPVAPNWTSNEDLLGYLSPIDGKYHHTDFSGFLKEAAAEFEKATNEERTPQPFHVVLDEMNLARVEYYFARFLSSMELLMSSDKNTAELSLGEEKILLTPNLFFIGTVNIDETTHGFADKVFDRAQFLELTVESDDIYTHIGDVSYRTDLMEIWKAVLPVAPFAFRVVDEIKTYIDAAKELDAGSEDQALDEQLLQKVLPKIKGSSPKIKIALEKLVNLPVEKYGLSVAKARRMLEDYNTIGFVTFHG